MNHLIAFVAGLALHILIFSRGEWDGHARDIVAGSVLLNVGVAAVLHATSLADHWRTSFRASTTLELTAIAGLFTSMLLYRTFFHVLCKYPGPFAARLSNLHILNLSRRFRLYKELHQLHMQYGDIVRLGKASSTVDVMYVRQTLNRTQQDHRQFLLASWRLCTLSTAQGPSVARVHGMNTPSR